MAASFTTQMQLPIELIICCSQSLISKKIERRSIGRHTCPCCSYTLLRHINSQGICWRCSHCYQEMPVLGNEIEKSRRETFQAFYCYQIMKNLPLEKQLAHRCFCDAIQNINDMNALKHQVCNLHLLYLRQQEIFAQMAKSCLF
jgi:ribosomal protein L37AE/L43A